MNKENEPRKKLEIFIFLLIALNVAAVMLESVESLSVKYRTAFQWFEVFSVVIFTVEYVVRLWNAKRKLKFLFSPFGLIDLIAILPFYLPYLIAMDLRMIRILRLSRLFRVVKIGRYSKSLRLVAEVLKTKREPLFLTLFITFLLLLFASSLMFYAENDVQPDKFENIFQSFWWAVATLTTVGYGDIFPVTSMGKFLSGIIAILGIGLVAMPTGIISSGFIEALERKGKIKDVVKCPHCGKEIE
jgi:voltage-gated potassium channel